MRRVGVLVVSVTWVLAAGWIAARAASPQSQSATAQSTSSAATAPAAQTAQADATDEGIPVTSDLVRRKCSSCHRADDKGRLTRISYRRTTPEGWEETIKRMVSLNGLKIEPAEAREVLRYLADHHGLAPEEARPVAFEVERKLVEYTYKGDALTAETCNRCHSIGRVLLQRRTPQEWQLLIAMHRGLYPLVDGEVFRRDSVAFRRGGFLIPSEGEGDAADKRQPVDRAVAHLQKAFPLMTPEWAAWSATMRPPHLEGRWAVTGYQAGKGPVYGQVVITPQGGSESGEFNTETTFTYARTGTTVTRHGHAIVYTGFQWRGRSDSQGDVVPAGGSSWREVLFVNRDWRQATGRWFTGAYDEFGIDVRLDRIGADPRLLGVTPPMIKTGMSGQTVRLHGVNLARVTAGDVDFGPGVKVDRIVNATPDELAVSVSVDAKAEVGRRSILITNGAGDASVAVYNTIDYVKVSPEAGLSRIGGVNFPKQYQQFEAIAYANGPDGKPDTKDDVRLGPVEAAWSIEEYTATYNDDDKQFVGTMDPATGLFTPNIDGPNPKRRHNSDNVGDVWAVATVTQPGAAHPLRARAHLLVTVPVYLKWDQPEVSR